MSKSIRGKTPRLSKVVSKKTDSENSEQNVTKDSVTINSIVTDQTPDSTIEIDVSAVEEHNDWKFIPNKRYFTVVIYGLLFVALGTLIFMGITHWNEVLTKISTVLGTLRPFIIAFFIAYILNPFVKWIDSLLKSYVFKDKFVKGRKMVSIGISYLVVVAFITITILYITPELINTAKDIEKNYSSINIKDIEKEITAIVNNLQHRFPGVEFDKIGEKINEYIPHVFTYGTNLLSNVLSISVSIVKTLINIVLAIVISCYMLADKNALSYNAKRTVFCLFSRDSATEFLQTVRECNSIFSKFIIGKSIDSLIIGIICFVVMNILKLDYAILLSVIVGITNMIPYFGPFIGAVPGVIIYLFINPIQALIFSIMIFGLQQFDGLYLGPKILGGSTGLTPLWVIFGITVGGAYFGVFGMFIGVPVVAVIAYLLNKAINRRLNKKGVTIKENA
ncbi:MAG: AI-2E family transporter [bacterium]|nr:AI-2E family transporter [bacterium]